MLRQIKMTSLWFPSKKEALITALLEGIPRTPGAILREWFYRSLFAKMGNFVRIKTAVEFVQPRYIEIGNHVIIDCYTHINSATQKRKEVGNNGIYIEDEVKIGYGVRIRCNGKNSKIYLREHAILERGVDIRSLDNGLIDIGKFTYIGPYTCFAGPGPVIIGNNCLIASHSGIYGNNHCYADPMRNIVEQGITHEGITIEDDCWLGSGVKVLDGVRIGRGSVIGAGAIVTKNIEPYSIAVGVPAKIISKRDKVT
jgi:acetyltransferase-like isoleucine patch superfamily enzyme